MGKYRSEQFVILRFMLVGFLVLVALAFSLLAVLSVGDHDQGLSKRVDPGDTVDETGIGAVAGSSDDSIGRGIYNKVCFVCHTMGVANTPRLGDEVAWKPRITQGQVRLLQTVIAGKGVMPPRGACMNCSDDDLMAAVEYMLIQAGYAPTASRDLGDAKSLEGISVMQNAPAGGGSKAEMR